MINMLKCLKYIICSALVFTALCISASRDGAFAAAESEALSVRLLLADAGDQLMPVGQDDCKVSLSADSTLSTLMADGVSIRPSEGLYVADLYLVGRELKWDSALVPLLPFSKADPSSSSVALPAKLFRHEQGFNTALISSEADGKGYTLVVILERYTRDASVTLSYSSVYLSPKASLMGALVDKNHPDNIFTFKRSDGGYTVLPPLTEHQYDLAMESALGFDGWLLEYPNGSTAVVQSGEQILPYADCTLTAQWTEVFVVCVSGRDVSVEYGEPLTAKYDIVHSTLDSAHSIAPGSISVKCVRDGKVFDSLEKLDAGEYELVPYGGSVTDAKSGSVCEKCCRFFYTPGKAEVSKRPLTVTAGSSSGSYSGAALTDSDFIVSGLASGDTVDSLTVSGSQLTVGSSDNVPADVSIRSGSEDVTENYSIKYESGKLTVNSPVSITIKPAYRQAEYCGRLLTAVDFELSSGALSNGDQISAIEFGGGSEGVCDHAVTTISSLTISHGGTDVTACYNIRFETGQIRVVPCTDKIRITAKDQQKPYDGTPLTESGCSFSGLKSGGFTILAKAEGSALVPGKPGVSSVASYQILDSAMRDVTAYFSDIELVDGTLTVTKCPLTISAANARKTYDGTELKAATLNNAERGITNGFLVGEGLVSGHAVSEITVTGSGTSIGSYTAHIESGSVRITDTADGTDVTDYYDISLEDGILEIVSDTDSIPVVVTASSADWVYDGKAHSLNEYKVSGLVDGDRISKVIFNSGSAITEAGTVSNTIESVVIKTASGENVADRKYAVSCVPGELTVEKYHLVITAASETLTATGHPLLSDGVSVSALANDKHRLDTVCAFSREEKELEPVEPGQYNKSVASFRIRDGNKDVTDNYAVILVDGVLTVQEDTASVKPSVLEYISSRIWPLILSITIIIFAAVMFVLSRKIKRKK